MSGAAFLRIKKLKGGGIITVAARHNKRVIQAEMGATGSIDPTRSSLNETLAGPSTAADVGQLAKDLMTAAGVVKLRKDAVMGLEIVFSLPPGHAFDDRAYFADCAKWAGGYFGGVQNILSVDIHRDEAQHHCHVLMLPLIGGRMDGSNMLGGKQKLMEMHKLFHLNVAARYGLSKAPTRLRGASKQAASKAVLQRLRETGDKALYSNLWATMRDVIESDPMPFLMALGIELKVPAKKLKPFVAYVTSKGKGPSKDSNPIGFMTLEKRQTLCTVGFTPKPPPIKSAAVIELSTVERGACYVPTDAVDNSGGGASTVPEIIRLRESDLDPALYDSDTGEYFQRPPPPARHKRQAADAWVSAAFNQTRVG